jgi:integrase
MNALFGTLTPHQFDERHIPPIVAGWKLRIKKSTQHNYANALRHLVAQIGAASGRPYLHHAVPVIPRGAPRQTIASPEEIQKLCAAAPTWLRAIILLALHTGFRRGDCLRIAPIHYDAEKRTISIPQQKNKRRVTLPVSDGIAALFAAAPKESPTTPLYQLHRGKPIRTAALEEAWHKLKKKAGVNPDLWIHDLRRTSAVSLYELTKDLRMVEQLLGHQSLRATIQYLEHRDPAKLKPYLDALFVPKGPIQ